MFTLNEKMPPFVAEAERGVLAGLMRYPSIRPIIIGNLSADCFYLEVNGDIFEAIRILDDTGGDINIVPISLQIEKKRGKNLDTDSYIADLYSMAVLGASASFYMEVVLEYAQKRKILTACQRASADAFNVGKRADEILATLDNDLRAATLQKDIATAASDNETADEVLKDILCPPEETDVSKTGLESLDRLITLQGGEMIVVGGRPGMGKSILGLTIADNLKKQGKKVLYFSVEMGRKELSQRQIAFTSHVPLVKIRKSPQSLEAIEKNSIVKAVERIQSYPGKIVVDDDSYLTPSKMRMRARAMHRSEGLDCVIIDYLQILKPDKQEVMREKEVAQMSGAMKALAKELDIPVIVLSQLNRKSEERADKRPSIADLRESGALEQDADIVVLVFRNLNQYGGMEIPPVMEAELIVEKNRNGETGVAIVACENRLAHFANRSVLTEDTIY